MNKIVLYASYPKTGSTMLPDILQGLHEFNQSIKISRFSIGKGKNNFYLQNGLNTITLIKTHDLVPDFLKRIHRALPTEPEGIAMGQLANCYKNLRSKEFDLIYIARNPFRVLLSAINYSKLLYAREEVESKWRRDGRDNSYFIDFLGYSSIPTPSEFQSLDPAKFPIENLERILWLYINSNGIIPCFGNMGYFDHISVYNNLQAKGGRYFIYYENLMRHDPSDYASLSKALDLPYEDLLTISHWFETKRQDQKNKKFSNKFYGEFGMVTPEHIKAIPSYPDMLTEIKNRAPLLSNVL